MDKIHIINRRNAHMAVTNGTVIMLSGVHSYDNIYDTTLTNDTIKCVVEEVESGRSVYSAVDVISYCDEDLRVLIIPYITAHNHEYFVYDTSHKVRAKLAQYVSDSLRKILIRDEHWFVRYQCVKYGTSNVWYSMLEDIEWSVRNKARRMLSVK